MSHCLTARLQYLAALEVAVGGGGAALLGLELVRVHGEAHGAPGLAPVKPRLHQHQVEALLLALHLHQPGPGHHHRVHALSHLPCVYASVVSLATKDVFAPAQARAPARPGSAASRCRVSRVRARVSRGLTVETPRPPAAAGGHSPV
eukprot:707927-Prorocentrum_minimum.AAC.1